MLVAIVFLLLISGVVECSIALTSAPFAYSGAG
jgi:hypothetical protein